MNKILKKLFKQWLPITTLNQYQYDVLKPIRIDPSYEDFIFRELNSNDFKRFAIFHEQNRRVRYQRHLQNGHHCYGFESTQGEIAAYFWLTTGNSNRSLTSSALKGIAWIIGPNEAYIWDCRTIPLYHRQGLYREGLKRLIYLCQQKQVHKIMINCKPQNKASNKGIQSAGFSYKGKVFSMKTPFFSWIHCSTQRPKILRPSSPATTQDIFPWN